MYNLFGIIICVDLTNFVCQRQFIPFRVILFGVAWGSFNNDKVHLKKTHPSTESDGTFKKNFQNAFP